MPKIINKIPLYLFLFIVFGISFFVLTGKFKLEVVNVSANNSEEVSNYIKVPNTEDVILNSILNKSNRIGFVTSDWCSTCNLFSIELKSFLQEHPSYTVYEFDLDEFRTKLRDAGVDASPAIITSLSGNLSVRENMTVQDLKDFLLTQFSN